MVNQIGRSTDASTADHRDDVIGSEVASFRYCNPGAQYPSARAARFGQTGYGIIGGGHKIARFPSPVNGAASNFDLLQRGYVGMRIGEAGVKWTGANGFGVPGYDPNATLTKDMVNDPAQAIPLLKAIANRESGKGNNLTEEQWRQAHQMFKAGSADAYLDALPPQPEIVLPADKGPSGAGLLKRAREHIGEPYANVLVPKDNPNWQGPWDCAEFVSWLVYQEAQKLYGCINDTAPPATADAYTGAWKTDLERFGRRVSVEEAAGTVGGIVLRYPPAAGKMGHIALCDGNGGTVEAKGRRYGVVADTVHGRVWDAGILIPGISYSGAASIKVSPPAVIYAVNSPNMDKTVVAQIQESLAEKGFDPGQVDGEFGPNTQAAVLAFQEAQGLVVDGAVGPETAEALSVSLVAGNTGTVGPVPGRGTSLASLPPEAQQLLTLILIMLSKEKLMTADPAKPGQGLEVLLPALLQSALSGKQLDLTQLLALLTTGKPLVAPTSNTVPASAVQGQPQSSHAPADFISLLVPVLYQQLTGKPWPGTEQKKADAPADPNTPVLSRPSVQLSAGALGIVTILQALGKIGLPFNLGAAANLPPDLSTTAGTLSTLIPLIVGAVGATGGWGALAGMAAQLFGGIISGFGKKP
ncbi:peptidoglycan-binding domain-containing protein [Bradyrhizobium sp. ARR65]|uniref:C40 family peptidase n=1 Tax=Bradyrhizobium sp. ARR65 TaxID=1040989 RepID=UPI0006865FAF|nr:peptidoglycan-binding domain-containing protein [Bradyrhizobium sp. ARR65]